jgi:hypothetical protein
MFQSKVTGFKSLIKSSPTFKSLIFDLSLLSEIAVIDVTCALRVATLVSPNVTSLVAVADEGSASCPNRVRFIPVLLLNQQFYPMLYYDNLL